jgi:hypothetical protein
MSLYCHRLRNLRVPLLQENPSDRCLEFGCDQLQSCEFVTAARWRLLQRMASPLVADLGLQGGGFQGSSAAALQLFGSFNGVYRIILRRSLPFRPAVG